MSADGLDAGERMQREIIASWSPAKRLARVFEISEAAFELARVGIRARHPEYSEQDAEWARRRMAWGDALFRAAHPEAPLLEP